MGVLSFCFKRRKDTADPHTYPSPRGEGKQTGQSVGVPALFIILK
jgi:hypothetical protein